MNKLDKPSMKQLQLIDLYTHMANDGYTTIDHQRIETAFSDMEIRAFKEHIKPLLQSNSIKTILDYGCGGSNYDAKGFSSNLSAKEYFGLDNVYLFEPARNIDQRQISDAVVNFDVLEHIFVADIPRIIRELFSLAKRLLIVNVACYPARALLPNGQNAHITVRPPLWWKGQFDCICTEFPEVKVQLYCSTGWRKVQAYKLTSASDWAVQEGFVVELE